ncbi:MAG: o-succinylbenzoate synthase, partial [Nostoc sp.]
QGIILRLTDESGKVGWGEITPISWFGSETQEQALDFCRQLPAEITDEIIFSIPDELPACQFGFESAREWGETRLIASVLGSEFFSMPNAQSFSALLPAGEVALNQWETLWHQGYRTFKWKIGV